MAATLEFENERVRVLRSRHSAHEKHPRTSRKDRVIIYLNDGQVRRVDNSNKGQEEISHKFGEVVWRKASEHEIENLKNTSHEVIIVELK